MDKRQEVFLTDLARLAEPKANLSEIRELDKWETVPYTTVERSGVMLAAMKNVKPEPVSFSPGLAGWYKIFICMASYDNLYVNLQLTGDKAFSQLCPDDRTTGSFEEVYWKSADMTGQDITLSKYHTGCDHLCMLTWFRFVPMSDDDISAYIYEQNRTDVKRIYATNDMHGHIYGFAPQTVNDWLCILENYRESDVYSLSMENIAIFDGAPSTGNPDTLGYYRDGDKNVQKGIRTHFTFDLLNKLVHYGHDMGLHMNLSMRMGAWGIEFPYDQMYFANTFHQTHKELRCFDRIGTPVEAPSYIYPEVQNYIVDQFLKMAATDCDGVEMIFTRGVPYTLFEQPFIDLFKSRYKNLDPRKLPISDQRVHGLHCEIMTGFVAKLRKQLNAERAARSQEPVKLIARVHASIENGRLVGLDVAEWANKRLIDVIVSDPMFLVEDLDADVWMNDQRQFIDLDKYRYYANSSAHSAIKRFPSFGEYETFTDKIRQYGNGDPLTEKARVESFKALGLPVYFEIYPRYMSPGEYKRRALALYEAGAEGISLWDTSGRVRNRLQWSMARCLGHKDELINMSDGDGVFYRKIRILSIAGQNISPYRPIWGG